MLAAMKGWRVQSLLSTERSTWWGLRTRAADDAGSIEPQADAAEILRQAEADREQAHARAVQWLGWMAR